ncbi:general odorant-binding protein 56d-like [Leptopilina boulardi]|uniref:general odorant-binding protein 56d-like n=1 Tax=Leptopilina boulardi TaxID=63433 RepID=UPI0021F63B18|nr:general odorant-binding protein 56d-like [Leptopilina boulardi]
MKINIVIGSIFTIILINNVEGKFNLDGLKKMTKPLKAPCIQQSGVDPELITAANNGNFADDPNLKCYFMCLLQKLQGVKGGKISVPAIRTQAQALMEETLAVRVNQLLDACEHTTHHEDVCVAAFEYFKCAVAFDSTLNFFPS